MWDEHEEITLSLLPETDTNVSLVPYLVVAFQRSGADWLASRHWLCGVDEVMISRGTSQTIQREGSRMLLELRDSFVSSPHAILRRYGVRWTIEDCNSKNGLSVNSVECLNTVLTG
ncbi:MAG TPA: FHA domain-containing protein, partial [Kofleriaceae bacterium]